MKQATLKLAAIAMIIGGTTSIAKAQTTASNNINVVTTAVPFLRVSPDARSTGMGETGIATSADAYSNFWNLGKTPFAKKNASIGATYTPWLNDLDLKDVYIASLAGYYKLDETQAISAGVRYFSLGDIQFTDASGNNIGNNRPREFAAEVGYSRKLGAKSGLGIGVRYISSDLASGSYNGVNYKKGSSVAGDIHYFHNGAKENGEGFNWGVTLSNLGSKISYTDDNNQKDFIPANLGLGAAYTKVFDADSKLTFAADVNKLLVPTPDTTAASLANYRNQGVVESWGKSFGDAPGGGSEELREVTASVGAEYTYKDQFSFRAGYFYESPQKGNRRYATVGAGLKYNVIGLNLAYIFPSGAGISRNPLSNTIRFSLLFDIDK
ncbi:type IX secretion system outer membrane channel protein PorV [Ferruginibacter yonginensis]|uniref:Type IX secretion system outer membrane channel protein PorV n=1 Tax=Ferruginibacter yonginensis TaxID=1310416 RepID=A0ABV8QUF1_9BACT